MNGPKGKGQVPKLSGMGWVLLVLAALLLVPAQAARGLNSQDKDKPLNKPPVDKPCLSGETSCAGRSRDLSKDERNCGSCGAACPAKSKCTEGTCECAEGLVLCDGLCVEEGTCPEPPVEPQCVNNASTFAVFFEDFFAFCGNPTTFCAQEAPAAQYLCNLQLPTFEQLPPAYQEKLAPANCFLNKTINGILPPTADAWCECTATEDVLAFTNTLSILNLYVGVDAASGEAAPPSNISAPAACPSAPFVPYKDIYLCDRRGLPGRSCDRIVGAACPTDRSIGQWNASLPNPNASAEAACRNAAFFEAFITDFISDEPSGPLCLPTLVSATDCQLQGCPCADPCPSNAWSITYPISLWKDNYCPDEEGNQRGLCADGIDGPRPAACDLDPQLDLDSFEAQLLLPSNLCLSNIDVLRQSSSSSLEFRSVVCGCLNNPDEAAANVSASSLNAVLAFNFTTLIVAPLPDVQPPAQCPDATFVPARNLYVCDAEGVEPGACECPKREAFYQWESDPFLGDDVPAECFEFVSAAAEGGKCLASAAPSPGVSGSGIESRCRLSVCPCPEADLFEPPVDPSPVRTLGAQPRQSAP